MFLLNSRSHHFTAAPLGSSRKTFTYLGRTLSRSYGANLPSSFTRVLSSALEYSSCPPVSVCGTVNLKLSLRGFSWKQGISNFRRDKPAFVITPQLRSPDLPKDHAYTLKPGRPTPGSLNLLRPPIASQAGAGILTRFPSATTLVLTLGADSPCADERGAGNLGLSATELFTLFIATHVSIRTSDTSSKGHPSPSSAYGTLSYHSCMLH